jgi:hypothetical protein
VQRPSGSGVAASGLPRLGPQLQPQESGGSSSGFTTCSADRPRQHGAAGGGRSAAQKQGRCAPLHDGRPSERAQALAGKIEQLRLLQQEALLLVV